MKRRHQVLAGSVGSLLAISVPTAVYIWESSPPLPPPSAAISTVSTLPPIGPITEPELAPAPPVAPPPEFEAGPRMVRRSEIVEFPAAEKDRVQTAKERVEGPLRELFTAAGLTFPAQNLFIRAFKRERELELWAAPSLGAYRLVATYAIAGASGGPGPKRREGDGQVPEGFYAINRYNPKSNFHLSMGLTYPNEADKILSDQERPGYDIFLHGRASSIGCIALGDDRIEEVYVAASTCPAPVPVHIFPGRMNAPDWEQWRDEQVAARPELGPFWENLREGWEIFERYRLLPQITVAADGRYLCAPPPHIARTPDFSSGEPDGARSGAN